MRVELLIQEGCPNVPPTSALLRDVLDRLAPGTDVTCLSVDDDAAARRLQFLGSPSIRIDGVDLEGPAAREPALCCRVYAGGSGVPPTWLLEAAVARALRPRGVLFLCVANSARSQMAEGVARRLAPAGVRVFSAGSRPTQVRPEAIRVLGELGIDTAAHHAKAIDRIAPADVDLVVTLCAGEVCPTWLGAAARLHWALPDPATADGDEAARLEAFRGVRDELQRRLGALFHYAISKPNLPSEDA